MENPVDDPTQTVPLLVTTDEPLPVNFTVEATNPALVMTDIATHGSVTTLQLPKAVVVTNSSQRNKGIRIKAENEKTISVYGSNHEISSSDFFTALPCIDYPATLRNGRKPRHRYYILSGSSTTAPTANSQFLIISCRANTQIRLTPTQSIETPGGLTNANQRTTFTLGHMETYLAQSRQDLTGTFVESDYPIAVFTGHECSDVPVGARSCNYLVEAVPSHFTWGTFFFTAPFAGRSSGEVFQVTALNRDLTAVNVTCTTRGMQNSTREVTTTNLGGDEYFNFTTGPDDFCCIESSQPILVMQYGTGASTEPNNTLGAPFMMTVPPVHQYSNNFTVSTALGAGFTTHYVNVLVSTEFFDDSLEAQNSIQLNNTRASGDWSPLYCRSQTVCGYGTQIILTQGDSTVLHQNPSAGIGVFVYGYGAGVSYGYPAGFNLEPIACEFDILDHHGSLQNTIQVKSGLFEDPCYHSYNSYHSYHSYHSYRVPGG